MEHWITICFMVLIEHCRLLGKARVAYLTGFASFGVYTPRKILSVGTIVLLSFPVYPIDRSENEKVLTPQTVWS
jgi:hypothetical protein